MLKHTKVAIDPGVSGAAAIEKPDGTIEVWKAKDKTYSDFLEYVDKLGKAKILMELVHASSKNGCKGNWVLSDNNTTWRIAALIAKATMKIISPQKWMKMLGPFSKDRATRKREIKAFAQRVYPNLKVTLWNADALAMLSKWDELYAAAK